MHTVSETHVFARAAKAAGMTESEVEAVVTMIAANPMIGDAIVGTGGCRKVRVAKPGRGKSGGYRLITFFTGENLPVFLITVFGKNEKANLTDAERQGLKVLATELEATYGKE